MKTKSGEVIAIKEFFKRWKTGRVNLKPVQKITNERNATVIGLIGYILSMCALIIFRDKFLVSWFTYGLILVFVGAIYSNVLKYLTLRQQIKQLKKIDKDSIEVDMNDLDKILNEKIEIEETK